MYKEPIFLEAVFMERIWGGTKLKQLFNYNIPSNKTGEAWVIAAHPNGSSQVKNGPLMGENLSDIWTNHPRLFGKNKTEGQFPLLVKILDADEYLSVQVHPDDEYARNVAGERYGKTECWYILDCDENAEIIFGHHALSKEQFLKMVEDNDWDQLLKRQQVEKGDFIYVPSGTIHAIGKGIVLLETQQNSDITYRIYDYDRKDNSGQKRELHIESAMDVITFPHEETELNFSQSKVADLMVNRLIQTQYFTVYHWNLNGKVLNPLFADYLLFTVIDGEGELIIDSQHYTVTKGDNFILPKTVESYELQGELEMIVSHE